MRTPDGRSVIGWTDPTDRTVEQHAPRGLRIGSAAFAASHGRSSRASAHRDVAVAFSARDDSVIPA
jgi:hypothetical protein